MENTLLTNEQLNGIAVLLEEVKGLFLRECKGRNYQIGYAKAVSISGVDTPDIEGFKKYLMKKEASCNTIKAYLGAVTHFFKSYDMVTEESLLEYKTGLKESYKPKTVNLRINGIIGYCKFIGLDVKVKGYKIQKALTVENVITSDEFNLLIDDLQKDGNERGYWLVMFLAKTGARANELLRLTKKGLTQGYEELHSKGKIRRIYYPQSLIDGSREYFKTTASEFLFRSHDHKSRIVKPLTSSGLNRILSKFAQQYNIRPEVMHPHSFRHLFAKEFIKNGGDLTLLSDLLGHESVSTTAIYTRRSTQEMSAELSRLMSG